MINDNKREGPEDYVIPRQEIKICQGCKYYSHRMVKSGRNPIYREDCTHPDVVRASLFSDNGNLCGYEGRFNMIETPDWCPYLKDSKIRGDE